MVPDRTRPSAAGTSAGSLLRHGRLWLVPGVLSGLVALVLSLLYMGGILTPEKSLHRLPIALVNQDTGEPAPGAQQNLGARISEQIMSSTPSGDVQWSRLDIEETNDQLAAGKVYGALVIPADFSTTARSLGGSGAQRPTLTVLTNPGWEASALRWPPVSANRPPTRHRWKSADSSPPHRSSPARAPRPACCSSTLSPWRRALTLNLEHVYAAWARVVVVDGKAFS
ncbi:YhgE/Pip domain-containing protein [Streptomyces globisporus]|uniref:YhgE/Pip domain-containing protein n=1 Tax=Streptomyces globisporus TaxID=1908 RepID=UPI000690E48E|nr:DUF3533 domain-containing protein [Streptomyces globisporus]